MKPLQKSIPYQPFSPLFIAAVLGILCDRLIGLSWNFWIILFSITFVGWLGAFLWKRSIISTVLFLVVCCSFFGFWHHDRWNRFSENDLGFYAQKIDEPAALQGSVCEMPRYFPKPPFDPGKIFATSERTIFMLHAERLRNKDDWILVNGYVLVVVEGDWRNLRVGDTIQLFGTLSKPPAPQNPEDYDYAGMLRGHRVLCIIRVPTPNAISVLKTGNHSIVRFLETIRRTCQTNFQRRMSPEVSLLAAAMILGIREGVDEETSQNLIETGTMHILAISGLHITIVAIIITGVLYLLGISRRVRSVIIFTTVIIYLFLTDLQTPAIRSTVLICVISMSAFLNRRSFGVNTLCATALIVLILNPTELFQFGAQLSFVATGAFFWIPKISTFRQLFFAEEELTEKRKSKLTNIERFETKHWLVFQFAQYLLKKIMELFLISLVIWGISMPLILDRFHLFTPIAVLVNPLLWIPLTTSMIGGFCTMIFGNIPIVGDYFGWLADFSFRILFGMIAFFRHLGGHYWVPGPPVWWNLVYYFVFTLLTFFPVRRLPLRLLVILLLGWTIIGFSYGYFRDFNRYWNHRLTLSVFSVGHGNCVLVTTPQKKTFVYDVGCISSPQRAADVMSRAIWRLGKIKIDAVIISHPDSDHYNGLAILADRFYIETVFVSPYMFEPLKMIQKELDERKISFDQLEEDEFKEQQLLIQLQKKLETKKIPVVEVSDGNSLIEQGLPNSIFLHPPKTDFIERENTNASSLVLYFEHLGVRVLLPGDLDGRFPSPFLKRQPIPCEIVMVPHHGGHSKQTEPLLQWTTPKLLLFSAGRFTHNDTVLKNYQQRHFIVRSTFEEGCIEISIDRQYHFKKQY
ncbi:MAG: ComEC/Rec2 family competence protein [Planctomycetaceae bacterium]|jgi:competence protein ComEC|nr:ComEC/Rec2 family competence protein [Planctomycetaceae bacterium]